MGEQMAPAGQDPNGSIATVMSRMADSVGRLLSEHLALARIELAEDAQVIGRQIGKAVVFVPFVVVGYGFLCAGVVALLGPWMGFAAALGLVGGVNAIGGGWGLWRAVQALRERRVMDDTLAEFNRSAAVLAPKGQPHRLEDRRV
jgi:uncharacterized membrane protein YqjE